MKLAHRFVKVIPARTEQPPVTRPKETKGSGLFFLAKGLVDEQWETYDAVDHVGTAQYQAALHSWRNKPDTDPDSIPRPPRISALPIASAGGNITSGRTIGSVLADQHIDKAVSAEGQMYLVAARGNFGDRY